MHKGERATRQQITIKYDHGRYYLQVQDIGDGQIERIICIAKKADRIQSHISTKLQGPKNKAKRHKARQQMRQSNAKARDLKNDAHWKAARALCETYNHVMIPQINCAAMKRFLAKSSTPQLAHWSHFQFQERLKHKADELGVRVSECTEQLTSMTCTQCLWVEESFAKNASKVFECRKCGFEIDRDHNASRNIFLMNGERFVGRMEPLPAPAPMPVKPPKGEVVSLLAATAAADEDMAQDEDIDDDDDDGCTGWMWDRRRRRSMNTNTTIG